MSVELGFVEKIDDPEVLQSPFVNKVGGVPVRHLIYNCYLTHSLTLDLGMVGTRTSSRLRNPAMQAL
jgi:hypothetical protein